jgi:hypothetical protein
MRTILHAALAVLWTGLALTQAHAGTANGVFNVNISLNAPAQPSSGVCVSSALSVQTNAIVKVVCATNQFVSIESMPGQPFVGTHGGAHRFVFGPGTVVPAFLWNEEDGRIGTGTITALRVLHLNPLKDRIELLVSF